MRLARFIRDNVAPIVHDWSNFAGTKIPAGAKMTTRDLEDHIREILIFISDDIQSSQSGAEQHEKSKGEGEQPDERLPSAAQTHAVLRLKDGFTIDQMVSEYRALRASVTKHWKTALGPDVNAEHLDELIRFNEAIDQAITESVEKYSLSVEQSRHLFLGIVGHDLRNPIAAVGMGTTMLLDEGGLTREQGQILIQMRASMSRAQNIVSDLFDLTRESIGSPLPVRRQSADLALLGQQIVDEMRMFHPDRAIELELSGNTQGSFDVTRIGQVLSNLIGNAVAHGCQDSNVRVSVRGCKSNVVLLVQNNGKPIPEAGLRDLFSAFVHHEESETAHLGLGLYITGKLVAAHGGEIKVTSSTDDGTTFIVTLPRQ